MNSDAPKPPREELEARLTALLLGELPAEEAAAWRAAIATNPELGKLHDRLKHTIDLVREVAASSGEAAAGQAAPLKLSEERRQKLLARFKTVRPKELARSARPSRRLRLLEVAAVLAIIALLAGISIPNFVRSRSTSQSNAILNNLRQLDGAKQQWAMEHKKSPDDLPTFEDIKPYMGRGNNGMPPSVAGETYNLGSVGDVVTADIDATKSRELLRRKESGQSVRVLPGQRVRLSPDEDVTYVDKNTTLATITVQPKREVNQMLRTAANVASIPPTMSGNRQQIILPPAQHSTDRWYALGPNGTADQPALRGFYEDSGPSGGSGGGGAFGGGGAGGGAGGRDGTIGDGKLLGLSEKPITQVSVNDVAGTPAFDDSPQQIAAQSGTSTFNERYGLTPRPGKSESGLIPSGTVAPDATTGAGQKQLDKLSGFAALAPPSPSPIDPTTGLPPEAETSSRPAIDPTTGLPVVVNRKLASNRTEVRLATDGDKVISLGDLPVEERLFRSQSGGSENEGERNSGREISTDFSSLSAVGFTNAGARPVIATDDVLKEAVRRQATSIAPPPAPPEANVALNYKSVKDTSVPSANDRLAYLPALEGIPKEPLVELRTEPARQLGEQAPPAPSAKAEVSSDVRDGRTLFEAGKLDEAEAKLNQALKEDPGNRAADYYQNLIRESRYAKLARERENSSKEKLVEVEQASADPAKRGRLQVPGAKSSSTLNRAVKDSETQAGKPDSDFANLSEQDSRTAMEHAAAEVEILRKEVSISDSEAGESDEKSRAYFGAKRDVERLKREANVEQIYAATRRPSTNAPIPQPEIQTSEDNSSTFSLNVSDVSFKLAAASLEKGQMPDAASVRSEEFINAFDYRDPEPAVGAPIAFAWERARYPFAHNRDLLRFSLKTAAAGRQVGRPLNIVLLLDNSGSMERADRVSIIREALRVLASQLQPQDKLSVITFARTARLFADGAPGSDAGAIAMALTEITPQGGTNLEDAMNLAYQTAARHYLANGINRVVLLTDGAANLGNVEPESLKQKVEAQRQQGIALDCFGIGWEGFNDDLLEVLSRNGDGRYGFLNSPEDAATDFAGQLAGALQVAASDVKVQVEFNPRRTTSYRQIGYAKHQLTKEQFRDNTVDAAEIAAQEAGNALYTVEVNPAGEGPLCTVRVRYKTPGTTDYREQAWDVPFTGNAVSLEQSSPAMRLAASASAFAEWLVASPFAGEVTPDRLLNYLSGVPEIYGADARPKKLEWMIRQAKSLEGK